MYATRSTFAVLALVVASYLFIAHVVVGADEEDLGDIIDKSPLTTDADRNLVFGGCGYNPYEILENRYKGKGQAGRCNPSGEVYIAPRAGNTAGIDSALACRLTKLFKAANDRGCRVSITSAYRSPRQQQCMCGNGRSGCAAAGSSCHQPGRAVDVSGSCIGWLRMAAPKFQLVFPYYGDHIQCAEHPRASTRSCNRPCNGGISINPDLSGLPHPSEVPDTYFVPPQSLAPSSGVSEAIRDNLGLQRPQEMCSLPDGIQVPCSAIANRGTGQPLDQSQQPQLQQAPPLGTENKTPYAAGTCPPQFYCANSTYYYRSSTCVDQVYQKCPAGCSSTSNTCASTSTSETSLSVIDQIGLIAEPTSTPSGAVSDLLFELAISGDDVATLQDTTAQSGALQSDGSYIAPPPLSQQTFISGDLRYSQADQYQPQQLTTLQRTLATMRDTLLRVLAYLRPFGRPAPVEGEYYE